MKNIRLEVKSNDDIINYLVNNTDYSKSKIKSLLKYKQVLVNDRKVNKLPFNVKRDDIIEINLFKKLDLPFEIIYEDNDIIVVNKKAGILTVSGMSGEINTLYRQVREYLNNKKEQLFIVNRLDKETSGIVMFAKSERIKMMYQNSWNDLVTKRGYIAVVEGKIKENGRIENLLYEENNTFVHSSKIGKKAITNYIVLRSNNKYTLLDIDIETGRKNQIRVHMSELGYPIVGDKKYGSKIDLIKRMCLHSYILEIINPITRKKIIFKSEYPKVFDNFFK